MGRTRPVRTLLRELKENSRSIEKSKKEYSNYLQRLKENYSQGKISYSRYVEILHTKRDGRNIHEWINYLNKYEGDCKKEIKKLEIKKTARNIATLIFSFAFIGFLFVLFSNSNFTFTGFTIQDQIQESSQKLNLEFAESGTYEWQISEIGKLSSVKLSGSAEGNGTAQVYLGELLVFGYSGEINSEEVLQNGTSPSQEEPLPSSVKTFSKVCEETCDLERLNLNDSSYSLRIEISGIKLNLEEITYEIISEADAENTEELKEESSENKTIENLGGEENLSNMGDEKIIEILKNEVKDCYDLIKTESSRYYCLDDEKFYTCEAIEKIKLAGEADFTRCLGVQESKEKVSKEDCPFNHPECNIPVDNNKGWGPAQVKEKEEYRLSTFHESFQCFEGHCEIPFYFKSNISLEGNLDFNVNAHLELKNISVERVLVGGTKEKSGRKVSMQKDDSYYYMLYFDYTPEFTRPSGVRTIKPLKFNITASLNGKEILELDPIAYTGQQGSDGWTDCDNSGDYPTISLSCSAGDVIIIGISIEDGGSVSGITWNTTQKFSKLNGVSDSNLDVEFWNTTCTLNIPTQNLIVATASKNSDDCAATAVVYSGVDYIAYPAQTSGVGTAVSIAVSGMVSDDWAIDVYGSDVSLVGATGQNVAVLNKDQGAAVSAISDCTYSEGGSDGSCNMAWDGGTYEGQIASILVGLSSNPRVNITAPLNNTNWSDTGLDIMYTRSDADGLSRCWYSNDTYAGNTTLTGCVNITNVIWSEGQHNVTIWANDTLGNVGKSRVSFNIDSIKPNIQITSPENNSVSSDNNLGVEYTRSDDIALGTCWYSNDTMAVNTTLPGCINITATDPTTDATATMTGYNTPDPNQVWATTDYTLGGEAAWKAFDGNVEFPNAWYSTPDVKSNLTYDFGSGITKTIINYTLNCGHVPQPGLYLPRSWTFEGSNDNSTWAVLDTHTADSTILVANQTYSFAFANTNPYRYYKLSITAVSSEYILLREMQMFEAGIPWSDGQHNVTIWANDTAGNVNSSTVSFTIGTSPSVDITSPLNNTNSTDINLDILYTRSDDTLESCWYSNDTYVKNTTLVSCGNITDVIWSEGQHNVTIWANNTLNNVGQDSVTFTIDSTKPNIQITSPANNSNLTDNTFDINYTVSDANLASCWYSNDSMTVNISLAPSIVRYSNNSAIMKPTEAWEGDWFAEHTVIVEDGIFHMWYRGNGGTSSQIGYANSTDGITWTKHPSNPILTNVGGMAYPYVLKVDSTYYLFASTFPEDTTHRYSSSNKINWTIDNGGAPVLSLGAGGAWDDEAIANTAVYYDASLPDPWQMLYEGFDGSSFQIGYANSTDGLTWTKYASNPIMPKVASTWKSVFVGNPDLTKIGDTYYAMYGGSDGGGWAIGRAKSVGNMTNWTDYSDNPIFKGGGPTSWDYISPDGDVADPGITYGVTGETYETYIYYTGSQNSTGLAYIQGLTFQEYMESETLPTCVNLTSVLWSPGNHNVTIWGNDTAGNVNYSTISFTITSSVDNEYPQFSEYWDNNNSLTYSGLAKFNTTITSTNGTVWLEINGENITASNNSGNETIFNATYNFSYGGIYSYKWHSWGNGTNGNYNVSNIKNYSITQIFGNSDTDSNSEWTQYRRNLNQTAYYSDTVSMTNFGKLWNYTMGNWSYTSSPAISHDKVYIGAYDKKLYVLNATTGANIWNYTTGSIVRSSPAVSEDIVYFGSGDKRFYAVNATNGTQIWNYTTLDSIYASPTVYNGIVYIPSSDNNTYALNAYDGTYIWNYSCPREMMTSSPAVVDGVLYVGCHDYNVLAINATNGSKIWNYSTGGKVYSSPAVADGIVYIGSNSKKLYALYASNGSKIWEYDTGNLTYSSPAVYGGIVYVGIEGGIQNNSYVLAANSTNGTHIWNQTVLDKIYSSPAVSNNAVFIGSNDNQTYAFDRVTGERLWNYTTDGNVRSSPAIANGIVYIGSDDKNVYAFKATAATGANPVIIRVWNESLKDAVVDPVEYSVSTGGVNDIPFTVTVTDIDGVAEINDSSIFVSFNTSNARRTNTTTCAKETGDANTTSQNYTCTVRMFYFDNNETWTIEVNASDTGNGSVISTGNQSRVFDYGFLKAFVLDPSFITWGSLNPGTTNLTSNQNTTLNNTGNVPINLGNIQVNAINLGGLRDNTQYLTVNNISSSWDGSIGMCGNSTNGILFVNATYISIPNANLTRGNVSAANATTLGQEVLYYCIPKAPSIPSQTYATNNSGSWTVRILLALLIPRKKKKKEIENDKLLNAFDLIADELKEEYSLNKVELLEIIIEKLKGRYGISKKEVLQLIKSGEELEIPATIFSKELGCLEAISKYMKENLNMSYREIAKEIGRDERTIWTSYKKAKEKDSGLFQIKAKGLFLPISIFRNNKLTILESAIFYLKGKGMNYSKIAEILNRDQRNIWTTYSRLIKKMNKE